MSGWQEWPPFGLDRVEKESRLFAAMIALSNHHYERCSEYRQIIDANNVKLDELRSMQDIPFLPSRVFKLLELLSIDRGRVTRVLTSSSTTGQLPAKVFLDKKTALAQTTALVRILQDFLGCERMPMLIIDHPSVLRNKEGITARGAGILGLSNFGRDHTYALRDSDMSVDEPSVRSFAEKYQGKTKLIFGFTGIVWKNFVQSVMQLANRIDLSGSILLHSGGWKKMEAEAVDNHRFKEGVFEATNVNRIHNFYGMAEQIGTIFVECEQGKLHAPGFADLLIRDARSWKVLTQGEPGLIQTLSILPESYPGHSVLTEDRGIITGEDDCSCGRKGKTLHVLSRIPQSEVRGCSDTQLGQRI
jgi:phenylacetate-coenzyme A ligase PaaK-like adenylate-forming protein